MDTRKIPPLVTLSAALVASVVTYLRHYELKDSLKIILITLIVFYIFSCMIKFLFDQMGMSDIAMKKKAEEEKKQALLDEYEAKKREEEEAAARLENEDGSVIEKETENRG